MTSGAHYHVPANVQHINKECTNLRGFVGRAIEKQFYFSVSLLSIGGEQYGIHSHIGVGTDKNVDAITVAAVCAGKVSIVDGIDGMWNTRMDNASRAVNDNAGRSDEFVEGGEELNRT